MKSQPHSSAKRGTFILIVTIALAASMITAYFVSRYPLIAQESSPASTPSSTKVKAIAALGYLEPQGEVTQLSAPAAAERSRVDRLLVKRGDRLRAGQIVAVLDSYDRRQAALEKARMQVKIAQANLEKVQAGAKTGAIQAQAAAVQQFKAEQQNRQAAQRANVDRLRVELLKARIDCGRYQQLYIDGAIAASEYDDRCLQEATLQKQVKEAEAELDRTVTTLNEQIREAEATLDEVTEVRPVDIKVAQAELEDAQAAVQQAQAELDLASVRSPRTGRVLEIETKAGELIGDQGIVTIGETDRMYVVAEVYETDISRVRVGQSATVTAEGVVQTLQGTVEEIGLQIGKKDVLGTDPVASADARVIKVRIRLEPEASQLVSGLTNLEVNVVIHPRTE
jgi:HlyD family secretion protein